LSVLKILQKVIYFEICFFLNLISLGGVSCFINFIQTHVYQTSTGPTSTKIDDVTLKAKYVSLSLAVVINSSHIVTNWRHTRGFLPQVQKP